MQNNPIKLIILFGSQAKGNARKDSDTDIAILAQRPLELGEKMQSVSTIAEKYNFPEDKVDLVDLQAVSPLLQMEVAKSGKLLKGSQYDFLRFKVTAWKHYQDTAKFRKLREKHLATLYE